jgi:hypothetical protein
MGETRRPKLSMTPEQQQQMEEALERRAEIDYQCFLMLAQLLPHVHASTPEVKQAVKNAEQLVKHRDQANHAFVAAVAGRA